MYEITVWKNKTRELTIDVTGFVTSYEVAVALSKHFNAAVSIQQDNLLISVVTPEDQNEN